MDEATSIEGRNLNIRTCVIAHAQITWTYVISAKQSILFFEDATNICARTTDLDHSEFNKVGNGVEKGVRCGHLAPPSLAETLHEAPDSGQRQPVTQLCEHRLPQTESVHSERTLGTEHGIAKQKLTERKTFAHTCSIKRISSRV
jgi:hypothetical protein